MTPFPFKTKIIPDGRLPAPEDHHEHLHGP
jgi:hypothetical protein